MRARIPALAALTGLLLASPAPVRADGNAPTVLKSRVDQVLAYSDQARVYRRASVKLGAGERTVELATLPAVMRPGTLRVESRTATVVRTQLITDRRRALPRQGEAKRLLAAIEKLLDRRKDLSNERQVIRAEQHFLDNLGLSAGGESEDSRGRRRERPGIFSGSWARVLDWLEARRTKIDTRLLELAAAERALQKELYTRAVEVKALDLGEVGRAAARVVATLKGAAGRHTVTISYLVPSVRWTPSYDLRYDPARRKVEAVYYASVSQSSGEAWGDARLRFSTDMPTLLLQIPELPTWTLGRKRDFTPTPRKRGDPQPPAWRPSPTLAPHDPIIGWVRGALQNARGRGPTSGGDGLDSLLSGAMIGGAAPRDIKRLAKPMRSPAPRSQAEYAADDDMEADEAREPPQPSVEIQSAERTSSRRYAFGSKKTRGSISIGSASRGVATESVPWSDAGYRPPALNPDMPAAAARGYRFTLHAPGKHTVPATGKPRRVPLLTRSFAVEPVYRINPGNSPWAYLVASVKNDTGRPILRGKAHLFSGAMFRGKSWLNTALPGHTIRLPLGVDDAVKVVRHIKQKTVVEGVLIKDDVTAYTVDVEVANNHAYPIQVELHDQVPLKRGEKVEVKGFSSKPAMSEPDDQGRVRWKGTVPARSVKKVSFTFQIVRPKDWEVRQQNG